MNKDAVRRDWKQIPGNDPVKAEGNKDYPLGKVQTHYGLVKDKAEQYLKDHGRRLVPLARLEWDSISGCTHRRVMMRHVLVVAADPEGTRIPGNRRGTGFS